jgi:hypothetical protein
MTRHLLIILFLVVTAVFGTQVSAETLLTVSTDGGTIVKDLTAEDLAAFPQITVRTTNEFVDGETNFEGPLVRDILAACNASDAREVVFTAANDYQITVDSAEFTKYQVILATSMNGQALSRRDKGPIWMIYPMSEHAELRDPVYNSRLIWQLVRMDVN